MTHRGSGDMGKVSCHAGGVDNIIERELIHERGCFEEERQRLLKGLVRYPSSSGLMMAYSRQLGEGIRPGRCRRMHREQLQESVKQLSRYGFLDKPTCFDHGELID